MIGTPLPVVFLHGIRVSGTMWRPQLREVGRHRPVSAPDMPGHGHRRGERFTMRSAVETVAEEIDALGGRALVAGLSMGGYIGIAAASRLGERVAGLVAMGCTAAHRPSLTVPYRLTSRLFNALPDGGAWLNRQIFAAAAGRTAAAAIGERGFATDAVSDVLDALLAFDPVEELARFTGPVWLVNGSRDHFRVDEQRFLEACVDGRLVIVPKVGHLLSFSTPHVVAQLINEAAEHVEDTARPQTA
ncbi:alpha/beta fold hydrolase [Saccharomonospora xinjiangensis]|uniref:Putative hydrolase or acyltransferase of alpha/beta superfamily n=1 Tax=Saccharomonospora xinjiangensis XJ-54 TaxID=882086 RepID=I0V1L8_9PSEU|nr:alpha/beta hydrolase [Saccharomonospora xinjiangensis]EID54021.1 putative hydrolase or acyltransferase of alpha/beta superfamily [Saccharomonospora xinjiangensis XJ-54]